MNNSTKKTEIIIKSEMQSLAEYLNLFSFNIAYINCSVFSEKNYKLFRYEDADDLFLDLQLLLDTKYKNKIFYECNRPKDFLNALLITNEDVEVVYKSLKFKKKEIKKIEPKKEVNKNKKIYNNLINKLYIKTFNKFRKKFNNNEELTPRDLKIFKMEYAELLTVHGQYPLKKVTEQIKIKYNIKC